MKKVVVIGGGTGNSVLLSSLKLFPIDLTTIISVSDNGSSTGKLREEINMPAIGDVRKVLLTLSEDNKLKEILDYRLTSNGSLDNHSIGNILMTGIYQNNNNNLLETTNIIRELFNIKTKVLPISEDCLTIIAKTVNDNVIIGEEQITMNKEAKKQLYYDKDATVLNEVIKALNAADLIIIGAGSLWTSILPILICNEVKNALIKTNAKILYVCNLVTQSGETTNYTASDHIKTINNHIGSNVVNTIILNNSHISSDLIKKYNEEEDKEIVLNDYDELKKLNLEIIEENLVDNTSTTIRHNSDLLAFLIYSYLMRI